MGKHHRPRGRLSKQPTPDNRRTALPEPEPDPFDYDGTLAVLRDNIARADAMVTQADDLIVQLWSGESRSSDSLTRRRNHVSYLLEAARLAVRAAMFAGDELDVHRRGA